MPHKEKRILEKHLGSKAMDNSGAIIGPLIAFCYFTSSHQLYIQYFLLATIPAILGVLTIIIFIKDVKTEKQKRNK